jgi:hypothetical protein
MLIVTATARAAEDCRAVEPGFSVQEPSAGGSVLFDECELPLADGRGGSCHDIVVAAD